MTDGTTSVASKTARAYQHVLSAITEGRFAPGFRLVLGQIAKELEISVVPVREAIRRLEAEGFVTITHNVGAQVAMVHEAEYLTTMQTLSIVEGAATAIAAPFASPADIARARAVNALMIESFAHFEPARFTELNHQFHSVLFEHCPNPSLLDVVHRSWARLRMLRESTFSFVPGRASTSVDEHEQLLRLIESGATPLEIEFAARRHRTATMDAYLDHHA